MLVRWSDDGRGGICEDVMVMEGEASFDDMSMMVVLACFLGGFLVDEDALEANFGVPTIEPARAVPSARRNRPLLQMVPAFASKELKNSKILKIRQVISKAIFFEKSDQIIFLDVAIVEVEDGEDDDLEEDFRRKWHHAPLGDLRRWENRWDYDQCNLEGMQ
ncbi:hypothetical protein Tco_0058729 [Tanacetum coccineum]